MFKTVLSIIFFLLVSIDGLFAQNAVTVERVKFDSLGDDWMQIKIDLLCNGSTSPDARNPDFVENITIEPLIAYTMGGGDFQFYSSSVEVMIMEARDKSSVYFYMPGLVVERDELPSRPDYYYIEVSIGGVIQDPSDAGEALSSSIRDLDVLKKMQSRAAAQSQIINNEGLLLPAYFAPIEYSSGARNQPVYNRREPKH
ncbi:MAG: hypothetical protein VXX82_06340 [Verrucomicrobiota bacterium]|nr:hypothetical protein [Verrucomicrobiota bacterium]